jgi:choline dehydrogenase-like flavoprotein
MIQDFRQVPKDHGFDTDVCIVGAGAAGITLARALAGSHRKVCLVESGALEPEEETLALNKGKVVGLPYPSLEQGRLRYFGGTTNHWNSFCRPLDPIDFEKRAWVPHSGWPIGAATLDPFYREAQEICELGSYVYDTDAIQGMPGAASFKRERVTNVNWTIGPPTRFGVRYLDDLEQASNVDILLNANVVELVAAHDARRVTELRLKSLDGKEGTLRPKVVVLACGGIENPRLLLASNGAMTSGLGNGRDLVGRYFADHVGATMGYVVPGNGAACQLGYGASAVTKAAGTDAPLRLAPALPADVQRREQLLNCHMMLECGDERAPGYLALREAGKNAAGGKVGGLGDALLTMLDDLGGTIGGAWRFVTDELVMSVEAYGEKVPDPECRVTLDSERDRLGMPQVRLDWRLSPLDKKTVRYLCRAVGEEMARLSHGRLYLDDWVLADDATWHKPRGWDHHMGTTRMSAHPATGVVDADCRVHGIDNLYIAGSSVFPTYGAAPPTLTIVALALRLAHHLRHADASLQTPK